MLERSVYKYGMKKTYLENLFTSDVKCSDKAWNMLCLNHQLYSW